jgi:hypothetical protein
MIIYKINDWLSKAEAGLLHIAKSIWSENRARLAKHSVSFHLIPSWIAAKRIVARRKEYMIIYKINVWLA